MTLTHIIKLDLGKNLLTELPENFGEMKQLKHLDLYHNQLTHLPLSFQHLKNLRWLDLKDNPLVPAVAKVAGPCLDQQQCTQCAKNVVQFFTAMSEQIEEEKQRRELEKQAELEVELANQKKQQKKKEKNKALKVKKNKIKAERKLVSMTTVEEQFISCVDEPVSINGRPKINKTQAKQSNSFVKKLFYFVVFFSVSLFVFTTTKSEFANNVKHESVEIWSKLVSMTPEGLQPWAGKLSNHVGQAHNATGKLVENSIELFNEISKNENVQIALDALRGTFNLIISEGGKLFSVLGNQAIVIRNEIQRIFIEHF